MPEYVFEIKNFDEENDLAVIEDEKGKTVSWPKEKIPPDLKPGDKIYFDVSPGKHKTAKEILNEILNPHE